MYVSMRNKKKTNLAIRRMTRVLNFTHPCEFLKSSAHYSFSIGNYFGHPWDDQVSKIGHPAGILVISDDRTAYFAR